MVKSVTVGNGGNKSTPTIIVGSSGNKIVREGWIGNSGNQQFFAGLAATDDGPANSASSGTRAPNVGDVSVVTTDGKTPYTISWVRISGSSTPSISDANGFDVFWTIPSAGTHVASWQYTVTDAHGTTFVGTVGVSFTV